jgi:hypothetical protein
MGQSTKGDIEPGSRRQSHGSESLLMKINVRHPRLIFDGKLHSSCANEKPERL